MIIKFQLITPIPYSCRLCFPECLKAQQKAHYGAPRFKPKMLKTSPKRTPTMFAIDHFDFYYAPLFDKKYPSIRLGLLMPHKFAAIVNRYSESFEKNKEIIESLGTTNLIERLTEEKDSAEENMEDRIEDIDPEKGIQGTSGQHYERKADDLDSRSASGIYEFLPPTREIRQGLIEPIEKNSEEGEGIVEQREKLAYENKFRITGLESVDAESLPTIDYIPTYPHELQAYIYPEMRIEGYPGPIRDKKNISSWWLLDGGSIFPVLALDLQDDDVVLDMCASPGGKSFMIAQTNKFATLICNDFKLIRIGQIRRALGMYIPVDSDVSSQIIIRRKDASNIEAWDDIDIYDKVLVDAPCTTDRLSANEDIGNIFATDRTTERLNLPEMQTKMLINALRSVRVGGSVVYSTCTMSPTQNEVVVENAAVLARQHYGIECVEQSLKRMERHLSKTGLFQFSSQQQRGSLILPWIISNFGPMYVCKLQRIK